MRTLIRLEELPLRFLHETRIAKLELQESLRAYSTGCEYEPINPFVDRFDETVDIEARPSTRLYLRYSLAETVFDLWQADPGLFEVKASHYDQLVQLMRNDRDLRSPPRLAHHFRTTVRRDLKLYGIQCPESVVEPFADWVYENPRRCPDVRLGYELYHVLRQNVRDRARRSDLGDFAHVRAVPYVDLITLDRRMKQYARQAVGLLGWSREHCILADIGAVLATLKS